MQQQPPRQREPSDQKPAAFLFEAKVENEEQLLDVVLAALVRGAFPAEAWERLHAAARRDNRASELAFAFESASQSKRLKTASPGVATEFLLQAARFFSDVFGDDLGAVTCAWSGRWRSLPQTRPPSRKSRRCSSRSSSRRSWRRCSDRSRHTGRGG